MENQWTKYLSKSGETLFVYNKTTGEHRWLAQEPDSLDRNINNGQPILCRELYSIATQTDDTGCINGCTSAEANAGCISSKATVIQVQMDDLEMERQQLSNGGIVKTQPIDVNVRNPPLQYAIPRHVSNHYVTEQSNVAMPMEVQVCDTMHNTNVVTISNQGSRSVTVDGDMQHAASINGTSDDIKSTTVSKGIVNTEKTKTNTVNIVASPPSQINTVASPPSHIRPISSTRITAVQNEVNNNHMVKHVESNHHVVSDNTVPVSSSDNSTKAVESNVATAVTTPTKSNVAGIVFNQNDSSITKSVTYPTMTPAPNQVLPPSQSGYVSGALYLGNGKFVNVLVPADRVQRGSNFGVPIQNPSALPQVIANKPPDKSEPGARMTAITSKNDQGVNQVNNNNLPHVVYPQLTNVFTLNNSRKNVMPVVHVQNSKPSASKITDKTAVNGSDPNVSYTKQDSKEPKQCVISNVFSYATGDMLKPQSQNSAVSKSSAGVQADIPPSPGTTPEGITIVKIEPAEPTSDIITEVHKCTYCCKTFVHYKDMILHQKTHSGERGHKCPHCDKEFRHSSSLKVHIKLHTGEKPYKCCSCDRTFRQKVHLRNHLRVHTENTRFNCSYCEKSFRHKNELYDHLVLHADRLPYKCSVCNRAFAQKNHLESHEQSHVEKKDVCPYCNKEFRFGSSLNLHLRTHTGEKPFKCSLCDLTFRQKQHLIVHVRRHTGERPFKCVHCNKAFRHDTALRSHLLIHPESKYSKLQASMFTPEQRKGETVEADTMLVEEQSKEPTEEAAMYREEQRIEIAMFMEEQRKKNVEAMSKLTEEQNRQTAIYTVQRNEVGMLEEQRKATPMETDAQTNDETKDTIMPSGKHSGETTIVTKEAVES